MVIAVLRLSKVQSETSASKEFAAALRLAKRRYVLTAQSAVFEGRVLWTTCERTKKQWGPEKVSLPSFKQRYLKAFSVCEGFRNAIFPF